MIDPQSDLASLHQATERLRHAVTGLDNAAVAEASRLPGWSRGHVLAHLARNADALVNVLGGLPMYPDATTRDTDIERDAPRSLDLQLADLRDTAARFREAAAVPADWARTVMLRNGVTDRAARVPFRRLVEIELHHVDLGLDHDLEDLSDEFVGREIGFLAERFSGNTDIPPLALSTTDGRVWRSGRPDGTPVSVTGDAPELMGWLAGRRNGSPLRCSDGALPALPPL